MLWVVVLAAGVSREELGSVVIVDDAAVVIVDVAVVIKDAKYVVVVGSVWASVVARVVWVVEVVGVVEVVSVGGVEFLDKFVCSFGGVCPVAFCCCCCSL